MFYRKFTNRDECKMEFYTPGTPKSDYKIELFSDKLRVSIKDVSQDFYLSDKMDLDKIDCKYQDGLMTIKIPFKVETPKTIEIQ